MPLFSLPSTPTPLLQLTKERILCHFHQHKDIRPVHVHLTAPLFVPWTCQVLLALPGLWPCPLIWMDTFQLDWAASLEITAGFTPPSVKTHTHTHASGAAPSLFPKHSPHCSQWLTSLPSPKREKKVGEKGKVFLLTGPSVIQPLTFMSGSLSEISSNLPHHTEVEGSEQTVSGKNEWRYLSLLQYTSQDPQTPP